MTEDSSGVVARLTALKDIKKGEEVTHSYTYLCGDHKGDTRIRKTLLREQFDFLCKCALCVNNPPGGVLSVNNELFKMLCNLRVRRRVVC